MLQETIKDAVAVGKLQMQSMQVLRTETMPGATKLGVRVRGTGDIAGVSRMLYALEAARPVLSVDNLQIQSRPISPGAPPGVLDVQLDVSSFQASTSS